MVLSVGSATAHQDIPAPNLGDTLNRTITLYDEERIGRILQNLTKNNYIIDDFLVNDYITYLGNRLSRNISMERDYSFLWQNLML